MQLPEILDVILDYLKVLAWPLVVFVLALVYRTPVVTLLQRLKKYSGWGQTVELGDEARELRESSEEMVKEQLHADTAAQPKPSSSTPEEGASADSLQTTPPSPGRAAETQPGSSSRPVHSWPKVRLTDKGPFQPTPAAHYLLDRLARMSEDDLPTSARRTITKAWFDLVQTSDAIAEHFDLSAAESTLRGVAIALFNRGLITEDTAVLAFRMSRLYAQMQHATEDDLSKVVQFDFVQSATNLRVILSQVLSDLTNHHSEPSE